MYKYSLFRLRPNSASRFFVQRYAPIKIIGIKIIRSIKSEKSAVTGLGPYKLQVKIS